MSCHRLRAGSALVETLGFIHLINYLDTFRGSMLPTTPFVFAVGTEEAAKIMFILLLLLLL